jgi:hypothetical protein
VNNSFGALWVLTGDALLKNHAFFNGTAFAGL